MGRDPGGFGGGPFSWESVGRGSEAVTGCFAASGDDFFSAEGGRGDLDPAGGGEGDRAAPGTGERLAADGGTGDLDACVAGDGGVRGLGVATTGGGGALGTSGSPPKAPGSMLGGAGGTWLRGMMYPHFLHFIRTARPATFSSAIWYFALQLGQRNFIRGDAQRSLSRCSLMDSRVASSGASASARSQVSTALLRKPTFW